MYTVNVTSLQKTQIDICAIRHLDILLAIGFNKPDGFSVMIYSGIDYDYLDLANPDIPCEIKYFQQSAGSEARALFCEFANCAGMGKENSKVIMEFAACT